MSVTVRIPTQLRTLTGGAGEVEVEGATVGEALKALDAAHPGFADRLFDEAGEPAPLRQRLPGRRGRPLPRRPGHAGRRRPDPLDRPGRRRGLTRRRAVPASAGLTPAVAGGPGGIAAGRAAAGRRRSPGRGPPLRSAPEGGSISTHTTRVLMEE